MTAPDDGIAHGTTGAYAKCRRRPQGSCQKCRDFRAAQVRAWRQPTQDRKEAELQARHQLAQVFPDVYRKLVDEALRKIQTDRGAT